MVNLIRALRASCGRYRGRAWSFICIQPSTKHRTDLGAVSREALRMTEIVQYIVMARLRSDHAPSTLTRTTDPQISTKSNLELGTPHKLARLCFSERYLSSTSTLIPYLTGWLPSRRTTTGEKELCDCHVTTPTMRQSCDTSMQSCDLH